MDIGSVIVGLGGLFIGGLSTYLSYQNKISSFQEKVYEEQLLLIKDYFNNIENALAGTLLIPVFDKMEDSEDIYETLESDQGYKEEFLKGIYKDVILPNDIVKLKNKLSQNIHKIITERSDLTEKEKKELSFDIFEQKKNLIQLCRKHFSIEELGQETLSQIDLSTKISPTNLSEYLVS